jgi:2-amino-4-hydroxy-6-hydroxymethyldihydropteridine diphosphokinase
VTLAFLGLGSNLGDRHAALDTAVARIVADPHIGTVHRSPLYETDPVGGPDQPDFLNAVVRVAAREAPDRQAFAEHLLRLAHSIEAELHRTRSERWGPRTIDIDVLAVGGLTSSDPRLTLPHPRAWQRAFVLVPWADLDPGFEIPGRGRVADLLAALPQWQRDGVRAV